MACPYCQGDATQEMERTTALGYRVFRCRPCRRTFNERSGTPFNHLQVPTDIALLVVLCIRQHMNDMIVLSCSAPSIPGPLGRGMSSAARLRRRD
jgi:transposase-like protein